VDPVPDPLLLRKSGSAGDRTLDLCICSQKLWPLDHRGGHNVETRRFIEHKNLVVSTIFYVIINPCTLYHSCPVIQVSDFSVVCWQTFPAFRNTEMVIRLIFPAVFVMKQYELQSSILRRCFAEEPPVKNRQLSFFSNLQTNTTIHSLCWITYHYYEATNNCTDQHHHKKNGLNQRRFGHYFFFGSN